MKASLSVSLVGSILLGVVHATPCAQCAAGAVVASTSSPALVERDAMRTVYPSYATDLPPSPVSQEFSGSAGPRHIVHRGRPFDNTESVGKHGKEQDEHEEETQSAASHTVVITRVRETITSMNVASGEPHPQRFPETGLKKSCLPPAGVRGRILPPKCWPASAQ